FSIEQSDGVTTPSKYLREATYELLRIEPSVPIEVIPNFVDTDEFAPAPGKNCGRRLIVHNSNFRPLKRALDVIRVFAAIRRTMPCELVLIGDGPDRSEAEKTVAELGLRDSVSFLGERLDFAQVLAEARCFVLPSESESFGLAALEALSCGVPVVASHVGGLPELITDGETGFLRPVGDVEGMAQAALRLLGDATLHAQMAHTARRAVASRSL